MNRKREAELELNRVDIFDHQDKILKTGLDDIFGDKDELDQFCFVDENPAMTKIQSTTEFETVVLGFLADYVSLIFFFRSL